MYAVMDTQAETFGSPFLIQTDGLALRTFHEAALNPKTEISKYPMDYVLYNIGKYDDETGMLLPEEPKRLSTAAAAIKTFSQNK